MARKLRIEYPGALYQDMNRGDHREPVFRDDRDREAFVETLAMEARRQGWANPGIQSGAAGLVSWG
jgi:hypothetical protein